MSLDLKKTSEVNAARRTSYAVVKASGENILTFLQGQITQDIKVLNKKQALYSVILNSQAKAITDFYLLDGKDNEFIMVCPSSQAVALVERLKQFMLGYQLRIGVVSPWQVVSVQGEDVDVFLRANSLPVPDQTTLAVTSQDELYVLRMPEAASDGVWLIGGDIDVECNVDNDVLAHDRVLKGEPMFGVDWDERVHPLNANLIERDGVSFDKGCYVGQEVTSRMHWKGGIRKKMYWVLLEGDIETLPCSIYTSVKVGSLTSLATNDEGKQFGIATLPIEVAESGKVLSLENGGKVTILNACYREKAVKKI